MREIKYRAWDKTREEMINVDMLLNTPKGMQQYRINRPKINGVLDVEFIKEDTILMQYTGLKDKNNVEIYEGDIVKYKLTSKELIAKVEFNKIKLGIDFVDDVVKLSYAYNFRQISNIEVIGNIYENPELLN